MSTAKKPEHTYVRIETPKGEMIVKLYNETPKHRDNFIKLVNESFYDGLLFHRVINEFMIQGGDPNSKDAKPEQMLGSGDVGYRVDFEFQDSLFHKKGALAAARDNNPQKASSGCQFYIVQGRVTTEQELDRLEKGDVGNALRNNYTKMIFQDYHRKTYTTIGGAPFLDRNYTVFGEVVEGLGVIDEIAKVETNPQDRPLENISMAMEILKKREIRKLLRALKKKN